MGENKPWASASSLFRYWLRNLHDIIFVPRNAFNGNKRDYSWSDCKYTQRIHKHNTTVAVHWLLWKPNVVFLIELEPSFIFTPVCCSIQPWCWLFWKGCFKAKLKAKGCIVPLSQYLSTNCASYECLCPLSARIYKWSYTISPHSVLNLVVTTSIHLADCCIKWASVSVLKVCLRNTKTETLQTLFCSHLWDKLYTFVLLSFCCIC